MKQFTTCANVANSFLKVFQGYTKGIRFIALLTMLSTIGVGQMWAEDETYTFTSKSWGDSSNSWTSNKDGNQLTSGRGVQVTTSYTGASATSKSEFSNVSRVIVVYSTNASKGAGTINIQIGSNSAKSYTVTTSGGTTDRNAEFNFSPEESGKVKITVNCTTNSIYVKSITITYNSTAASTYTVTYDKNGATSGTVPTDATQYDSGATVTVKSNSGNLAKTGYTFAGWNTKADGTGTTYAASSTFTISANTTLYAKWTVNTYTVIWVVDGETERTDTGVEYNTSKTAPAVSPIPCGDVIAGWTDAENGNYVHSVSTLYSGATPSITITSNKTFYAVFADYAE